MNELKYIITSGKFETDLIQKVLPNDLLQNTKVVTGAGDTSALSLARSYYTEKKSKILLLVEAETFDDDKVAEKKKLYENMIYAVPGNSEIKIIVFVPEIESLLFIDKHFIENFFGKTLSDFEFDLAQRDPKFGMIRLKGDQKYSSNQIAYDLLNQINQDVIGKIQKSNQIQEIINFFN
jgi:hypothetical protein